jgi:hypothetical protein
MKSRSIQVLEKSIAAAVSGIEIYNKPDFKYRAETFSILIINAWELLLKAKILDNNKNKLSSIYAKEKRKNKDGSASQKLYIKRNRSGNPMTLSMGACLHVLRTKDPENITDRLIANLTLLTEIRDNAIHLTNHDLGLQAKLQEVGTACLKNYIEIVNRWFEYDMTRYNFFLMPLSFFHEADVIESFSIKNHNQQTENLLKYLKGIQDKHPSNENSIYNVTLKIETKFVKSSDDQALNVRYSDDPDAPEVRITEEDILKKYPFDYKKLTVKLVKRYSDFKQNQRYHKIRAPLKEDEKYCLTRRLDPKNPKSMTKDYYSTEVFKVLDKHYTKK